MAQHIVIVGNGVAGITAAMTARARDGDARITVVSAEAPYFFARTALMYALMDRMQRRDLEPHPRRLWAEQRIERVYARATDLDANARTLRLDRGGVLAWDKLLLCTGAVPRRLHLEGLDGTEGVVGLVSLQDLDACERWIPSTREAVVVGGGLIGIELVECLVHHGVRTTFVVRDPWYWPAALCAEEGAMIEAHLRARGVEVRAKTNLVAVQRDRSGRVAGVSLDDGSSRPAQMLGVCIGVEPAVDWLRAVATPPSLARGVRVDAELRTSLRDVWAAGDCAELDLGEAGTRVETTWYAAKAQGETAGLNLTGRASGYAPKTFFDSAKLFDLEYTTVGDLDALPAHARSVYRRHPSRFMSQRIVHAEGRVLGFNLIGSRWDHTVLARWIDETRSLPWVLAHLGEAQFDAEFGRAPLGDFVTMELSPRETA